MNKKHKIRLIVWIMSRQIVILIAVIILSSIVSAIVNVIDPVECSTIPVVQSIVATNEVVDNFEDELQKTSTMELMITGQELEEAELKEIKRKKREAKRKKQKKEKEKAWLENFSNSKDKHILEHLCNGEAGDQNDECQQAVVWVVLNRIKSKNFPDTVEEVVFAHRQYACTWDGNYDRKPSERVKKNVQAVLSGKSCIKVPENVVYQAQFTQGSGIWQKIGTETFCFK